MDDHDAELRPPLPGFRLTKLEVLNWGTFDEVVYSVRPSGQTTLLVGENGSGKSTLVDALLTLLVRPQTRNYNVAAGATKNERDERTYIRGAYDRTVGEGGRPQIQYLRPGHGHYTVLLACFGNAQSGKSFTICQVLYLNHENAVEKIYAFHDSERGILQDLCDLETGSAITKVLKERGYRTSNSYKQYLGWLQRSTGFRPKAMDIFNQTVAVKDVQRLDLFIRQHMLERKPWNERVTRLLNHFVELSEAHRMLVRVREQEELLRPVVETGIRYHEGEGELRAARALLDATPIYFASETVDLLKPLCDKWTQQIRYFNDEIQRLQELLQTLTRDIARIELSIDQQGGDRLRQLPMLIEQAEQIAKAKRIGRDRFEDQLRLAGVEIQVTSAEQMQKARELIHGRRKELLERRQDLRQQYDQLQFEIGGLTRQLAEDRAELEALQKRRGNLPESFISLRERMCHDLRLAVSDLPFVAELIAVDPQQRVWEASIEQVLHAFARSMLVATEHYGRVAGYVDRTRLLDGRGQGQRLVYLRVGKAAEVESLEIGPQSLVRKLVYREDHPLTPWLRAEIAHRFDFQACETVEDFQRAQGAAMTANRHLKTGRARHEKDDRAHPDDRRHFVLGWDNRAKRQALADSIRDAEADLHGLQERSAKTVTTLDQLGGSLAAMEQALALEEYDAIDNLRHEFEASRLRLERQKLEESDDRIRELRAQAAHLQAEHDGYHEQRDAMIAHRTTKERELKEGAESVRLAQRTLAKAQNDGVLEEYREQFSSLRQLIAQPLTLDNVGVLPEQFERKQRIQVERLQNKMAPVAKELITAMTRFLKKFPDEQTDLDANLDSLSSFESLFQRIVKDDLPKHEDRFKRRLNEKVLHEIGLLHGELEGDRQEIRDKIEQLNGALRLLEWKPGTHMRLEPSEVQDREVHDFRRELANCLNGTLDGTAEANEATFIRIEKLVSKLRDEANSRWRDKVVDVRNWFNFAAREIVTATGEGRSYYEGGTGQSGGEKGKLAFLVLVAAIAYQYDLEPDASQSDRFHFVMVDEMFSRSDDQHAEYALELFERFGLQLLIVAPLDAKARITEPYVGTYLHVVKNKQTHRSELLSITAEELHSSLGLS